MIRTTLAALVAGLTLLASPAMAQSQGSAMASGEARQPTAPLPTDTPPTAESARPALQDSPSGVTQSSLKSAVRKSRSSAVTSMVTTGNTSASKSTSPGS